MRSVTIAAAAAPSPSFGTAIVFEPVLGNFDELLFSRGSDFTLNFVNSLIVGRVVAARVREGVERFHGALVIDMIGYGSQGHAHAQNLYHSGVNVVVGLRKSGAASTP